MGWLSMLTGVLDPLEGSLLILPGSGLVALGTLLDRRQPSMRPYCVWVFLLVAFGVGAMFGLSALGGIGGGSGHSIWWGGLMLPSG